MADIKTRDAVKGTIKTIDKAAVASQRMKNAYAKTKDKAEQGYYADENSPTEYASDRVSRAAGRVRDEGISGTFSDAKALLEQCKSNLESTNESDTGTTYSLKGFALYTDSTGNNVMSEDIAYGYIRSLSPSDRVNFDFEDFNEALSVTLEYQEEYQEMDIELLTQLLMPLCDVENQGDIIWEEDQAKDISYIEDISGGLTNAQVYDSYYGGYRCKDGYLVTKTDEKTTFVLDSLDTPNIVIDPKSDDWVEE